MAKVVSWNARGLCNLDSQGSVSMLLKKTKANVILIQETKIKESGGIDDAKLFPKEWKWVCVPSIGLSGGMVLAWNPCDIIMKDSFVGTFSISIVCTISCLNVDCFIIGVYGPCDKRLSMEF
ncbi:hypothetical protein FRX31_018672 [Thalictrum thalictroides]|uniref:Uncharacterized protein n=1 Tax=Thalictrum thalictroides TaxID=46969 RepID=A0A7J6W4K2_THATH|nr:hypothetical protein FRX31_018672 [Thalictrum thalictroides]